MSGELPNLPPTHTAPPSPAIACPIDGEQLQYIGKRYRDWRGGDIYYQYPYRCPKCGTRWELTARESQSAARAREGASWQTDSST